MAAAADPRRTGADEAESPPRADVGLPGTHEGRTLLRHGRPVAHHT